MSKRLMPTYLVNFLEEIYDGTIPSNFGKRMVSRQFIARAKALYDIFGGYEPSDYSRRMVSEYLIKFFNEIEIVEYTDDDVLMTKTISSDLVYPACRVDSIGGMSYKCNNLIDTTDYTLGGNAYNATITITKELQVGETYTISYDTSISSNLSLTNATLVSASGYVSRTYITFTVTDNNVVITFAGGSDSNNLKNKLDNMGWFMLNVGSTALPYEPYFEGIRDSAVNAVKTYNTDNELLDTYTVPSAITSLEGYGQGINSTVYNNVDFASGKYVKKVGVVDLGSLTWTGANGFFQTSFSSAKQPASTSTTATWLLCSLYEPDTAGNIFANVNDKRIGLNPDNSFLQIRDNSYTNYNDFKTAMEGVLLYYELATPVETTITEQAPLLETIDGGTIVFENDYNQNMPNEVTAWIKGN